MYLELLQLYLCVLEHHAPEVEEVDVGDAGFVLQGMHKLSGDCLDRKQSKSQEINLKTGWVTGLQEQDFFPSKKQRKNARKRANTVRAKRAILPL